MLQQREAWWSARAAAATDAYELEGAGACGCAATRALHQLRARAHVIVGCRRCCGPSELAHEAVGAAVDGELKVTQVPQHRLLAACVRGWWGAYGL